MPERKRFFSADPFSYPLQSSSSCRLCYDHIHPLTIRSTTRERLFPLLGCPQVAMGDQLFSLRWALIAQVFPLCFFYRCCHCCCCYCCYDCCHHYRQVAMRDQLISLQWVLIAHVVVDVGGDGLCVEAIWWDFENFNLMSSSTTSICCSGVTTIGAAIANNVGQVYEIFWVLYVKQVE